MKKHKRQTIRTRIRKLLESKSIEKKLVYLYLFAQTIKVAEKLYKANKFVHTSNLKKYSELNVSQCKSSDTLFLMGSGESINDITTEEWQSIKSHDSLGFNFWLIHEFVPDYYMFEAAIYPGRSSVLYDLLKVRENDYSNIPWIGLYMGDDKTKTFLSKFPEHIKQNIYMSNVRIPGDTRESFRKAIKIINFLKLYKANLLLTRRGTIIRAILFGLSMNYKKIVLCGVDLNNTKYFYEHDQYTKKNIPIPKNIQTGVVHKTIDPTYGELTVDVAVEEINEHLLKPNGVELYIGSKKSALYPMLPYYFCQS